jgi:hypothetical protein
MGLIIDDMVLFAVVLGAALASGASGASLFQGGDKSTRTFRNSAGKTRRVKMDGALKNIDPVGTAGHITDAGADYGRPVDARGRIISSDDSPLERLNIGSYDAVKIAKSLNTGLKDMLMQSTAGNPIFQQGARKGSKTMAELLGKMQNNPDAMKKYVGTLLGGGKIFDPSKMTVGQVVDVLTNPANIPPIIQADPKKYKDMFSWIHEFYPDYDIQPTMRVPWFDTKTGLPTTSGSGSGTQVVDPDGKIPEAGAGGDDKPPPIPPLPEPKKPDPKEPKKPEPKDPERKEPEDDDPDKPKPPLPILPDGDDVQERPINPEVKRRMANQQWYPKYQFGGQDLLRLTEVEKLEELKNYTLFDLVNPLLAGDEDNLLALQNKIQENRRFTNTYANPKPERPLPPAPDVSSWAQPMKSVYPVPYPMSLDQPQAQNYYDYFDNQDYQYLNKTKDRMAQGGLVDPDMQKVLNSKRDSFTATDSKVMKHEGSKLSLLEDIDSGSVTQLDIMMLR